MSDLKSEISNLKSQAPACIYLVLDPAGRRVECGKPATHYLVRTGRPRHFYCDTHAGYVRSATRGCIVDPI